MILTKPLLCVLCALMIAPVATAQLVVGVNNEETPVFWVDTATGEATELFTPSDFDADGIWGLAADDEGRCLYYSGGTELYRVPYDTMVPEYVADFYVQGDLAVSVMGLGFDPDTGRLFGTPTSGTEGFYAIDPDTGESTLIFETDGSSYDFGGFDYDAVTDAFYGLNDDISPFGRGLYEVDMGAQTVSHVADYPAGQTDLDGLAVGDGLAFLVSDDPGEIFVYNLVTEEYEASLPSPWFSSELFSGATWAPGIIPSPASLALLAMAGLVVSRRGR